jgi:dTDP-4-dehydrorhamnose reductase
MNIIILGSNGMLGSMLCFYANKNNIKIIPIDRTIFNAITDPVEKLKAYIHPESYVINCIGAIPQKKYNNSEFIELNTSFPHRLNLFCKQNNAKLIHISTNCVFSGKKTNYIETDIPDEDDVYGKSKYEGEPQNALTIRCSIIGFEKKTNYGLLEWFLQNKSNSINGYVDSFWNGLTTLELTKIIFDIIENDTYLYGIRHYYSNNTLSKYDILDYVKKKTNKLIDINPVENGIKYYTLNSIINSPRKSIYEQIDELLSISDAYKL